MPSGSPSRRSTPGTLTIGPFDVRLAHVNHPVETFGFRFTHGGRSLVYTGDTGETEAVPALAAGADVFLSEAAFLEGPGLPPDLHLTARQAAALRQHAGRGPAGADPPAAVEQPRRRPGRGRGGLRGAARHRARRPGHHLDQPQGRTRVQARDAGPGTARTRLAVMTRPDGRAADELRPVRITRGWLDHAEGSVLVEFGKTRVLCAASVTEEVPRWRRGSGLGWVTAEYAMLPRATNTRNDRESVKGRIGGRTHEISRLVGRSLRAVVDYKALGENTIVIDCDVLQADGGTRTAAVTGGYVALADAIGWLRGRGKLKGSPLTGSVAAVSVGIIGGEPRLDLCYEEDSAADTDMNVVCTGTGDFVEVQGTAEREPFSRALLGSLLDLGAAGCAELTRLQQAALAESRAG